MTACVTIRRAGTEAITELQPLYATLHAHQVCAAPKLAGMPARSTDEAWRRRRAQYERWLAKPGAFVLLAERGTKPVGYAAVSIGGAFDGWASGERVADVHDLVVAPEERNRGVGGMLMDALEREVAAAGVAEVRLRVVAANAEAVRFYTRRGMTTVSHILVRRLDLSGGR